MIAFKRPYRADAYDRSFTASAVVNQPLFTAGLNTSRIREALARDNREALNIEVARRAAVQSLAQAWNAVNSTGLALSIQEQQLVAQVTAFEGNRIEQSVGLRSTIDVLNAEQELQNARFAVVQSRHDQYLAKVGLLAAMGILDAKALSPGITTYRPEDSTRTVMDRGYLPWRTPAAATPRRSCPWAWEKHFQRPGGTGHCCHRHTS